MGSLTLMRPALYDFIPTQEEFADRMSEVLGWYKNGDINLDQLTTVPLQEVASLHEALLSRQVVGKAVLKV